MKLEELITKLEQIEQQASLTLDEYPHGLTVERQRLIIALAKQLQSHLKAQQQDGPRDIVDEAAARYLYSVDGGKASASN
jgi:hypothetical protein